MILLGVDPFIIHDQRGRDRDAPLCHRHVPKSSHVPPHTRLLTTNMFPLATRLRVLPRTLATSRRAPLRSFHSPFVVLNASTRFAPPSPSTAAPVYEKQEESSSEPHLTSSGTRTYVVSEPDPSDTPYEVPSGAYPASASYDYSPASAPNAKGLHNPVGSSVTHPHTRTVLQHEAGAGASAAGRNVETPGETGRARTKTGKL